MANANTFVARVVLCWELLSGMDLNVAAEEFVREQVIMNRVELETWPLQGCAIW